MSNYVGGNAQDPLVAKLRAARERAVVLKTKLMTFRSSHGTTLILVFEGIDDPLIYSQWLNRLFGRFEFESLVCSGKAQLLEFMAMMNRDANGFNSRLLYFIDRDYDESRNYQSDKLFMTDTYSVENYLVTPRVIDALLRVEFHCSMEPDVRNSVLKQFTQTYRDFLNVNREVNRRIYAARILKIEIVQKLPIKINPIAVVELDSVSSPASSASDLVKLAREPSPAEWDRISSSFDALDAIERHRGKFATLFIFKWLELLADDYKSASGGMFSSIDRKHKVMLDEIGLSNLASKSDIPTGLAPFVTQNS